MSPDEEIVENGVKGLRSVERVTILLLGFITSGAVGGLVFSAVVHNDTTALTQIGLIATSGLGALGALLGVKHTQGRQ